MRIRMPKKARRALRILRDARRHRIPFIVYRARSGAPEFGRVDGVRIRHVLTHGLCGFCVVPFRGEESCYLAQVDDQGTIMEVPAYRHQAPMHPACLETALQLCPELATNKASLRIVSASDHAEATQRLLAEVKSLGSIQRRGRQDLIGHDTIGAAGSIEA